MSARKRRAGFDAANSARCGLKAIEASYGAGTELTGTLCFLGGTFASLVITAGSHANALPNDAITLRFGLAVIPLPATLPPLAGGRAGGDGPDAPPPSRLRHGVQA